MEFVKYQRLDPKQPKSFELQEAHYLAYLLTPRGAPQWVALGEAAPIEAQIGAALAVVRHSASTEARRGALQQLDALVLAPIRARLPSVSHLILAPDSELNLVPPRAV